MIVPDLKKGTEYLENVCPFLGSIRETGLSRIRQNALDSLD